MTTIHGDDSPGRHSPIYLCNLPPWVLASAEFNSNPQPVRLAGVRESNRHLFRMLDEIGESARRGQVFHDYLDVKFMLHQWASYTGKSRSSLRNTTAPATMMSAR